MDSRYELEEASDRETIDFTRLANSACWKGVLPEHLYVTREKILEKCVHALPSESKVVVFLMREVDTKTPVSAVEALVRKHWRFDYHDGQVVQSEIQSACIGAVYTNPEHRRKGLGKVMIDKLVELVKARYVSPHGYLYLYSEVGEYYCANGFTSVPVDLINFPCDDSFPSLDEGESYELINYHGFHELATRYTHELEGNLRKKVAHDHLTRVALVPESWVLDWFHIRAKFISYVLFHKEKLEDDFDFENSGYAETAEKLHSVTPHVFGIKLLDHHKKAIGFVSWTFDWKSPTENYVSVLQLVVFSGHDVDKNAIKLLELMRHHVATAKDDNKQKTHHISVWESLVSESVKALMKKKWSAKTGVENSSRSAIMFSNETDQAKFLDKKVIWEDNTKLSWF